MEPPVLRRIRMRFVARIDDRPPNHRVQIHERFEKIRPLRNLIVDGAGLVFRADLAGPGINRPRHKERREDLGDAFKWHRPRHEIILVVPIAVALTV